MRNGTPMFSAADRIGISPNDWKMNATDDRRISVRSRSAMAATSRPSMRTVPLSGRSSPPMMLSSVVLPDPERPDSATSWPRSMVSETPRSACTAAAPVPNVRVTPLTLAKTGSWAGSAVAAAPLPGRWPIGGWLISAVLP